MGLIIVLAFGDWPQAHSWQEYSFIERGHRIPAERVPAFLQAIAAWRDRVEPIYEKGDIVGLRVSSRVRARDGYRLRDAVAPHLLGASGAGNEPTPTGPGIILDLEQHGLHIPEENVDRCKAVLRQLGDIQIQDDDDSNIVALMIPRGVPMASVLRALEIDAVPIEHCSNERRKQLIRLLRERAIESERASRAAA